VPPVRYVMMLKTQFTKLRQYVFPLRYELRLKTVEHGAYNRKEHYQVAVI
jgi:hypothetical protein